MIETMLAKIEKSNVITCKEFSKIEIALKHLKQLTIARCFARKFICILRLTKTSLRISFNNVHNNYAVYNSVPLRKLALHRCVSGT